MAIDELRVGLSNEGARTGAAAILRTYLVWTLFFLFTAAAFVGEAALRDEATGFADLVRATAVDRRGYALGRFIGAFLISVCPIAIHTRALEGITAAPSAPP